MFALSKLFRRKQDFEAIRREAKAKHDLAKARGDTRAMHATLPALNAATHDALRAGR